MSREQVSPESAKPRMSRRKLLALGGLALGGGLGGWLWQRRVVPLAKHADIAKAMLEGYSDLAYAMYSEAWERAQQLQGMVGGFVSQPSLLGLQALRQSWSKAHEAFARCDFLRFSDGPIDNDRGGRAIKRLDAWPVDATKLDAFQDNRFQGLVHNREAQPEINSELLSNLHAPDQGTVVLGFHALELLLWGQAVDGQAPLRIHGDFVNMSNADRRAACLQIIAERIALDMKPLMDAWHPIRMDSHRKEFLAQTPEVALGKVLGGLAKICSTGLDGKTGRRVAVFKGDDSESLQSSLEGLRDAYEGQFSASENHAYRAKVSLRYLLAQSDAWLASGILRRLEKLAKTKDEASIKSQLLGLSKKWKAVSDRFGLPA